VTISGLTQSAFSKRTGIARSSVTKLLPKNVTPKANPDLSTLCRIAKEINIPVALLLMTSEDWTRLITAVAYLPRLGDEIIARGPVENLTTAQCAERALEFAGALGVLNETKGNLSENATAETEKWEAEAMSQRHRQRQGIRAAAALPRWGKVKGDIDSLFAVCVQMGATTNV
jgi:transcriptional regulator with XRE-family HTH domain